MSYGSNNPPWQRNASNSGNQQQQQQQQQIPSLQSQMGLPNPNLVGYPSSASQSIYSTNMAMSHQQQQLQTGGVGGGTVGTSMFGGQQTVAYPTRGGGGAVGAGSGVGGGGLNPNAFGHQQQQHVGAVSSVSAAAVAAAGPTTSSRIGTVTKIQADFGFIDEEVFFHRNSCKGSFPKLGDRVLVEATFNTNAPFKWNATRVQLMGVGAGGGGGGGVGGAVGVVGGVGVVGAAGNGGQTVVGLPPHVVANSGVVAGGGSLGMSAMVGGMGARNHHAQPPPQQQHHQQQQNNHHSQPPPHHGLQQQQQQHLTGIGGGVGGGNNNNNNNNNNRSGSGYNAVPPPNAYAGGFGDRSGGGGGGGGGGGMRDQRQQQRNMNVSPSRRSQPLDNHHQQNNNGQNNRRNNNNDHRGGGHGMDQDDNDRKRRRGDNHHGNDRDGNNRGGGGGGDHRGSGDRGNKDSHRSRDLSVDKSRANYTPERRGGSPGKQQQQLQQAQQRRRNERRVAAPRYMVQVPKVRLDMVEADVLELRRRYTNLYVPSDFFFTEIRWPESFPPNATFSIQKPCAFHIAHRSVEAPTVDGAAEPILDAPDADYLFSAKVMLMGVPPMADMYRKCFAAAEDLGKEPGKDAKGVDDGERGSYIHPTRLINFLVGVRGKNEAMAIGGPWSPSLDGAHPDRDPGVLIRTAIRTCRALTGIDLTPCTQWYRFVELYYRRAESVRKGRTIPARVETVVVYLPDVRSCVPTRLEWDDLNAAYRRKLDQVLNPEPLVVVPVLKSVKDASSVVCVAETEATVTVSGVADGCDETAAAAVAAPAADADIGVGDGVSQVVVEVGCGGDTMAMQTDAADPDTETTDAASTDKEETGGVSQREPTPGADLSPKTMKVSDLREELAARQLSPKGLKPQLIARLLKAIKSELEHAEEEDDDEVATDPDNDGGTEAEVVADGVDAENSDSADASAPQAADDAATIANIVAKSGDQAAVTVTDIDMTDIMVIDEYDSTKSTEGAAGTATTGSSTTDVVSPTVAAPAAGPVAVAAPTVVVPKPLDERDRRDLEKRYKLPEHPHLIVHPSRTAKAGKFSCNVMSLSILLDYRPEDSKEHSFEVSLFAELFNEMLMRDFGFNIYKALVSIPEKSVAPTVAKSSADKEKDKDKETAEATTAKADEETKEVVAASADGAEPTGEPKEKRSRRSEDEETSTAGDKPESVAGDDRSRSSRRREDDEISLKSDSTRRRTDTKSSTAVVPLRTTVDPELLLSFVYFDQTHCGYILEKDVEELFYTLGLHLSRAQTRRLLQKCVQKEAVAYRKLTDRTKDEQQQYEDAAAAATTPPIDLDTLARGNRAHLPVFRKAAAAVAAEVTEGDEEMDGDGEETGDETTTTTSSAMVAYKGGFVDIEKLLEQMRRSEKARTDTEQLLVDLRKQNADLAASSTRSKEKIRDLQSDVKSYSRKLGDAEQLLSGTQKKNAEYHSILSSVYDRVAVVFAKPSSSSSTTSSSSSSKTDRKDKETGGNSSSRHNAATSSSSTTTTSTDVSAAVTASAKEDTKDTIVKVAEVKREKE